MEEYVAPASGFLFINHDAKRLRTFKDRSHRAVVNQHVQRTWLKDKKRKKSLQSNVFGIARTSSQQDATHDHDADPSNEAYPTPPSKTAPYKSSQLIRFRTHLAKAPQRQKAHAETIPYAAFNILTHGNTDPFNTLAIPLDVTVSHLLQYSKEVMIPSVYSMEVRSATPALGITKAWEHVTLAFEDECAISAYLAISATSVMRVAPSADLDRVALKYNNRSSALLRQRIAENQDDIDPRLYIVVLWLAANALATGEFTAGMVHANTLCYLVRQGGGIAAVEPFQRENILQFDVQFAMMFLRHPFFKAVDYAPGPFNMNWLNDPEAVSDPSPSNVLITYPPLTPSLTSPEIISIISDLRDLHAVYIFIMHNRIPGTSPIFRWLYLQKQAVEARLLDFCCNMIYTPISPAAISIFPPSTQPSTPPDHSTEYTSLLPAFCIAALYWTAMAIGYSKQKIHACSMLLTHLRSLLSVAAPHYFTAEHQSRSNANTALRLWILYVGSMAEQAMGSEQTPREWRQWCTTRFVRQMRWMGVHSYVDCRDHLERILFADRMHREEGRWEGRTVWGKEDVHVKRAVEGKGIERWWGADGRETGFESWWRRIDSYFVGVVAG